METTREATLAAVAQTTQAFDTTGWAQVDLSTVGPNLTTAQPGADVASVMIENKSTSTGSAYVVFKADPGDGVAASTGWEIAPGGVLGENGIRGLRYISIRAASDSGTVKIMVRSFRDVNQAPWTN